MKLFPKYVFPIISAVVLIFNVLFGINLAMNLQYEVKEISFATKTNLDSVQNAIYYDYNIMSWLILIDSIYIIVLTLNYFSTILKNNS